VIDSTLRLIQIAYNEAYRTRQRAGLRHIYEDQILDNYLDVIESAVTRGGFPRTSGEMPIPIFPS